MILRALLLPAVAVVSLVAVGCDTSAQGSPIPTSSSAAPSPSPSKSGGGGNSAPVKPCALLSQDEVTQLGLNPGKADDNAAARFTGCQWAKGPDYTVGIYYAAKVGLGSVNRTGETAKTETVGSHDGLQLSDVEGCNIWLALTKTTSVLVGIDGVGGQAGCQLANQYASLVEPKLPAQQR